MCTAPWRTIRSRKCVRCWKVSRALNSKQLYFGLGASSRFGLVPVQPAKLVPPHAQRIRKRRHSAPRAYLGALHIVPSHGHFDGAIAQVLRDEQHLHVEAEAIQQLPSENLLRRARFEQLE